MLGSPREAVHIDVVGGRLIGGGAGVTGIGGDSRSFEFIVPETEVTCVVSLVAIGPVPTAPDRVAQADPRRHAFLTAVQV